MGKIPVTGSDDGAAEQLRGEEFAGYQLGLNALRRRRWFLWGVIIVYLPLMWCSQQITHSFQGALPVFGAWCLLLVIAAGVSALAKCPRCGNYYHVNGMTMLYLRKCLHCQLPINADRPKT